MWKHYKKILRPKLIEFESLLCLTGLDECKVKTLEDCRLNVSRDFNFADDQIRKQYIKTKQYFERVLNEDGSSF